MCKLDIYMQEPLPECEQEIRNEAHKRDMITSTNIFVVSVLVHDGNKKKRWYVSDSRNRWIQEIEDLDNLSAVKKDK